MKKLVTLAVAFSLITGCAPTVWVKPGASQDEFSQDRYACMQQAQQRVSHAQVNPYGGQAASGVVTNEALFEACMNARGWYLERQKQYRPTGEYRSSDNEMKKWQRAILIKAAGGMLEVGKVYHINPIDDMFVEIREYPGYVIKAINFRLIGN